MQPVNPDLQLLIRELEKEQRALKKMVRQAGAELDNLIVYYHSEALLNLNQRLDVLYSLQDPLYQQKEDLKRQIDFRKKVVFIKKMNPRLRQFVTNRNEERALDLEKELQRLIDQPVTIPPDTRFIDEALLALYDKRCRSFQLKFGDDNEKEYQTTLTFRVKRNKLEVKLKGHSNMEEPDFVLDGRIPNHCWPPVLFTMSNAKHLPARSTFPGAKPCLKLKYGWPNLSLKIPGITGRAGQ